MRQYHCIGIILFGRKYKINHCVSLDMNVQTHITALCQGGLSGAAVKHDKYYLTYKRDRELTLRWAFI